jgi:PST family polysaccharide transporter/lipopolysaccharide exporter
LIDSTALAFYQNAYRLSNAPATEITQVISSVMFPAYSTLQGNLSSVRSAYFRTLQITSFVAFPAALGIAAVAPVFVQSFMGTEWMPMVGALQILAVYGMARSIGKTTGPVFNALGRPDYVTKLGLIRLILVGVLIIPAVQEFGIEGAAAVVVLVSIFPMIPTDIHLMTKTLDAPYRRFAREMGYPLAASIAMFVVVDLVRRQSIADGAVEFILLVVTGAVVYVVAAMLLEAQFDWGIKENIGSVLRAVGQT